MGLLTILKKVKQKEQEIRILILGLDNAGYVTSHNHHVHHVYHHISLLLHFQIIQLILYILIYYN